MGRLVLEAHAKVNLALSVGAPHADGPMSGMHPIASWMAPVELSDTVEIATLASGSEARVEIVGDGVRVNWLVANDLTLRAVRALENETGRPLPVGVRVTKRIPAGGGLGGGSSDAAAVLRGVDALLGHGHGLGVGPERLRAIGASIGSDIPFFIDDAVDLETPDGPRRPPRPALVGGLGGEIERLEPISGDLVLICPPFGCPTGEVYRAFDGLLEARRCGPDRGVADEAPRAADVERLASARAIPAPDDASGLFNDLEAAAYRVRPELGSLARSVRELLGGAAVRLSGSGSTLFVFGGVEAAGRINDAAGGLLPAGTRAVATRLAGADAAAGVGRDG